MPLIKQSTFDPPKFLKNGHLQTIYPSLFRSIEGVNYFRERIDTPDDDFLDLDWSRIGSNKLVILSHGLEGNSERAYIKGMARAFNRSGWDALAWNFRGCGGTPNRLLRSYHSGASEDLDVVINHSINLHRYTQIALVGFSMGGNITLKYLGERAENVPESLCGAVAISVPCHLASASAKLARWSNIIYMRRFLRSLHEQIIQKMRLFPGQIDDADFHKIHNFKGFDDRYTAPLNGFSNAEDYWEKCSSKKFMPHIRIPSLLINAQNDPFLSRECYPVEIARKNACLFLEMPVTGGHVGFVTFNRDGEYWSEHRAVVFLEDILQN